MCRTTALTHKVDAAMMSALARGCFLTQHPIWDRKVMKQEIVAEFTKEIVKTVARRFVLRVLGPSYFVALALAVAGFVYLVCNRVNEWTTGAIGVSLGLGILFPVVLWWKIERSGLGRLRRMSSPHVKFVFDDRGVTADSELGAATIGWKSIENIWEFPEAWLLMVGKQQYVTLPISALTDELKEMIKTGVNKDKKTSKPQPLNSAGISKS